MSGAISTLILGPSGAGKSSFLRSALRAAGSGIVAMAPGRDEENSYGSLLKNPAYVFEGFDDVEWMPTIGSKVVAGKANYLRWAKARFDEVKDDVAAGLPPRYKVFGMDTATSLTRLGFNSTLAGMNLSEPPPAQSPDGFVFYSRLRQSLDELFRIPRAMKGYGVHWIALGHISERDIKETASSAVGEGGKVKGIAADVPGGFRDVLPSFFDVVMHAGVRKQEVIVDNVKTIVDKHYLRWKPSPARPTKSRFGSLDPNELIPNSWESVYKRIVAAEEARDKE